MRIAFVVYGSLNQVSGGFIYDRSLVRALVALGHSVDVIGLPWVSWGRALAGGFMRSFARGTPVAAAYDVVIEDELVHPSVAGRVHGVPPVPAGRIVVSLVHNLGSGQPGVTFRGIKTAVERRYLAGVDGIIAVCARTLADVRALGVEPAHALVAHPGRDHVAPTLTEAEVTARSAEPGPLRVLHAAAVVPSKGLLRLLDAVAGAGGGATGVNLTLDVVGSLEHHRYVRRVQRRIADLGLSSRVRLHGQLRDARLADLFRRSQVFALPSDREAYSLACLEAMGYGLPVLATANGGLDELVGGEEPSAGQLLGPEDLAGWTDALARLARNRDTVAAMGRAALARYRQHATWREVASRVVGFLEKL